MALQWHTHVHWLSKRQFHSYSNCFEILCLSLPDRVLLAFNRSLQITSFRLLGQLTVKIITHTTSIMNWHYYQNWNWNLFTIQRSFIVQGCKICHNMNLMQYRKCKCRRLVYVPMLPTMKSSNENAYWLARVGKLNFILPGQVTTGKPHFTSGLHSWET
jgi:hypothetical protein